MIRCTNKVLSQRTDGQEQGAGATQRDDRRPGDMQLAADTLGFPLVLKIPDSSFSRGVKRAKDFHERRASPPRGSRIPIS